MICSYRDCPNVSRAYSSITFFSLPKDGRRDVWIKNSGNLKLAESKPLTKKVFCERHFAEKDLRRQFNRTILRRDAVPIKFMEAALEDTRLDQKEELQELKIDKDVYNYKIADDLQKDDDDSTECEDVFYYDIVDDENNEEVAINSDVNPIDIDANFTDNSQELVADSNTSYSEELDSVLVIEHDQSCEIPPQQNRTVQKVEPTVSQLPPNKKPRLLADSHTSSEPTELTESIPEVRTIAAISSPSVSLGGDESNNEETYFALSLIGIFKRLPPQKRAVAKCNILRYLTELEYGSSAIL